MSTPPITAADLELLCQWDTPTICNALEVTNPERRGHGFTVRPFMAANRSLPPICGLARTGTIRAAPGMNTSPTPRCRPSSCCRTSTTRPAPAPSGAR